MISTKNQGFTQIRRMLGVLAIVVSGFAARADGGVECAITMAEGNLIGRAEENSAYRLVLASLFKDRMVLHRNMEVPIWGRGVPGETVTITASWGVSAKAKVASNGSWKCTLHTPKAGGPHTVVVVSGEETVTLQDVLSGEVWLASGQSNMEMTLVGWPPQDTVLGSEAVISASTNDNIRFFTVQRNVSVVDQETCDGEWVASNPAAARGFSATAYFFAKRLNDELNIPIGIIHSSWGGTIVEAWMTDSALVSFEYLRDDLERIPELKKQAEAIQRWREGFPVIVAGNDAEASVWSSIAFRDDMCGQPEFDDTSWPTMTLPTLWRQKEMHLFDGAVWFRRSVTIPKEWVGKELTISLGPINAMDRTFVEGKRGGGWKP